MCDEPPLNSSAAAACGLLFAVVIVNRFAHEASMAWLVSEDQLEIVAELETYQPRAMGIVAAAIIEDRLTTAIKVRLSRHEAVAKSFLNYPGPAGDLSAKIDFGYLLEMYGPDTRHDLHIIRDIRNKFAHALAAKDFGYRSIADKCKSLKLPDNKLAELKKGGFSALSPVVNFEGNTTDPQIRFRRSAQIALVLVHLSKAPLPGMPRY